MYPWPESPAPFWRHRPADRRGIYRRKAWRLFRSSTWVRRKSRTSALRLSISSTEKAGKRRCQGYNSLEEAAAAAAAAAADVAGAPAPADAPALEDAVAAADAAALGAAGGAAVLEAAGAAGVGAGVGAVVGAVVGAAAAGHGEGARPANRATFRLGRRAQVLRAGFDNVRCGNDVLFAELRRWGAGHACARPPVGRPIYREILNSEKLVCEPGNGDGNRRMRLPRASGAVA